MKKIQTSLLAAFALIILSLGAIAQNKESAISIVPKPVSLKVQDGMFKIDVNTKFQMANGGSNAKSEAAFYQQMLFGKVKAPVLSSQPLSSNAIVLNIDKTMKGVKGSYTLTVTPQRIMINAANDEGLFYGVQTLRQLLPVDKGSMKSVMLIPAMRVEDAPRFEWRGMHLDVSRHFFSLDYLKTFIDRLAMYKFNKFHLHLTDDQGWRLEIDKYPKLTSEGAWRELNNQDSSCIQMAKKDPSFALPEEFFKVKDGKRMYGGFYTKNEMRDLIAYASARKITIVPEIDMPGHMMAAIKAYPGLTCGDEDSWGQTFSTPLCPAKEQVYKFLEDVLSELVDVFPSEYIHIGADEVEKTTWENSPIVKELMAREGITDVNKLQSYFVKRIEKFLHSKGRKMIGWDEVLEGGVSPSTTVMYWRGWAKDAPKIAAKAGNKVIMTPTDYSYFDYPQDAHTLEKLYNAKVIPAGLTAAEQENIMGVQGNIWTEYIPTTARLEYMVFPRMLAMAELGWSATKDYAAFSNRMIAQYKRLDAMGVQFRVPDIADLKESVVFIDTAWLRLNKPKEVASIRYTIDGTAPTVNSTIYTQPVKINGNTTVQLATFMENGRRGDVSAIVFDKQTYLPPASIERNELKNGLNAAYYEGKIATLKSLVSMQPIKSAVVSKLDVPSNHHPNNFGMVYSGYIDIPTSGIYTFYLNADDGASLTIGGRLVIDNDGPHAPKEKTGQIALEAGLHTFTLPFFEAGGGFTLGLKWDGPGITMQTVSPERFYIKK